MRLRYLIIATCLSLASFSGEADAVPVTLDQARQIAQAALEQGEPRITLEIVSSLLQANPKDSHALLLASAANRALGEAKFGRRAASLAYRHSNNRAQKLQAAQLAAEAALAEERPTLTQIWLRRASLHTETEAEAEVIARAYRRMRAINPWSFNIDLSIRPSSNVNNGSESDLQIIDGIPVVGQLSGGAQALSGLIGTLTFGTEFRLRANETSRTSLGARTQIQRVSLSSEAERIAPEVSSRDFAQTYADLSLRHTFSVGTRPGEFASVGATLGGLWSPDDLEYSLLRLEAERVWRPKEGYRLSLSGSVTGYNRDGNFNDSASFGLRGGYTRKLDNGDGLGFTLAYDKSDSDAPNRRSESVNARVRYSFARAWGPAQASASLSVSHADYQDYRVGFIEVPGGRQDTGAYADLSLFFADYDYAGFAPRVTIRAGRKSSNVSRFETRELSVGLSIQSKF